MTMSRRVQPRRQHAFTLSTKAVRALIHLSERFDLSRSDAVEKAIFYTLAKTKTDDLPMLELCEDLYLDVV